MKTVLVVDDSQTIRRMVIESLRRLGDLKADEAGSGLEAIERLSLGPLDLVILDMNMPDMHGLDVLAFLRTQSSFQDLPVVVLTTRSDALSRETALAAGATDYLTKPFDPRQLAATAGRLLAPSEASND